MAIAPLFGFHGHGIDAYPDLAVFGREHRGTTELLTMSENR
jgi:hypothetical protein